MFAYISLGIVSYNRKRRKYWGPGSKPSRPPQPKEAHPAHSCPYSPLEAVKSMATVKLICVLKRKRPRVTRVGVGMGGGQRRAR